MTESEARRIYKLQSAICWTFGRDIREACREKGIPEALIQKFMSSDREGEEVLARLDASSPPDTSTPVQEKEARKIFDHKAALCATFGGDLRKSCLEAGLPEALIDKFMREDSAFGAFLSRHDPDGRPIA
jgi:hypothetical protein